MEENIMLYFWVAMFVVFSVVEIATAQLVTIWFAVGTLAAIASKLLGAQIWIQWIVFIVVSVIALIVTRPLVRKFNKKDIQPTNADRCIGETAVVEEKIDNIAGKGQIKVNGIFWSARSVDNTTIDKNEQVKVIKIEGVKLIVEKIK